MRHMITNDPIADAERIDWIDDSPSSEPMDIWQATNESIQAEAVRLLISEMDDIALRRYATDFVLLQASEQDFIKQNLAALLEYLPAAERSVWFSRQKFQQAFATAMVDRCDPATGNCWDVKLTSPLSIGLVS